MTESIENKISEIEELLKDMPADSSTFILLTTLKKRLDPVYNELEFKEDIQSKMVAKQIKLIINLCSAIIELLDVRKANLK